MMRVKTFVEIVEILHEIWNAMSEFPELPQAEIHLTFAHAFKE